MAGPILNLTIFRKSTAHTLRAISVITFPPGFLLLLISGITSGRVNPAISIIPLFFSSAFGVLLLANEKQCGCQSSGLTGTPIHLVFDLVLGISIFVCLILTWVFLPQRSNRPDVMLGTYCTNFLITNLPVLGHSVSFYNRELTVLVLSTSTLSRRNCMKQLCQALYGRLRLRARSVRINMDRLRMSLRLQLEGDMRRCLTVRVGRMLAVRRGDRLRSTRSQFVGN